MSGKKELDLKASSGGKLGLLGPEMDDALRRIQESSNVVGYVVLNEEGLAIKSSLDSTLTVQYADLIVHLSRQAKSVVRALDPTNELEYFRVRGKRHEIMIAPDTKFTLFVIQNPLDAAA